MSSWEDIMPNPQARILELEKQVEGLKELCSKSETALLKISGMCKDTERPAQIVNEYFQSKEG